MMALLVHSRHNDGFKSSTHYYDLQHANFLSIQLIFVTLRCILQYLA